MHSLQNASYLERLFLWQLAIWSSGYFIATQRSRRPVLPRLALALPLAIFNFVLPLLFDGKDDAMTAVIAFMTTAGLSNFKLLAWVMNRGPLAEQWLTKIQCAAVYVFTVIPVQERRNTRSSTTSSAGNILLQPVPVKERKQLILVKILGLCVSVPVYAFFIDRLPHFPGAILQGINEYLSMSFFMDATSLLLWHFLKLQTAANFSFPYASTSPADLWNRRWNLPVSHAMRAFIYDPFLEGRLIKAELAKERGEERNTNNSNTKLIRRVIGVLLVFSVSGIMHELMYWYLTGRTSRSVLWLKYFIYSGIVVVLEGALKQPFRRAGVQIPVWIQRLATAIFFQKMTEIYWWGPAEEAEFPKLVMQHVREGFKELDKFSEDFVGFFNLAVFKMQEAKY